MLTIFKARLHDILLCAATLIAFFSLLAIGVPHVSFMPPGVSFRALFNYIFALSEQYQAYEYIRFATPSENYDSYIFVAVCVTVVIIVASIFIFRARSITCAIISAVFIGFQIYFGIFAGALATVLLFACIALSCLRGANKPIFCTVVVLAAIVATLFYTGENAHLTQLSEGLRDSFGTLQEQPQEFLPDIIELPQLEYVYLQGASIGAGAGFEGFEDEQFAGSQIGAAVAQRLWVLLLIGIIFVLWAVILFSMRVIAACKRRAIFNNNDNALAIDALFKHAMRLLTFVGVPRQNIPFAAYRLNFGEEYTQKYLQAVKLWERAVYSTHAMSNIEKQQLQQFVKETKKIMKVRFSTPRVQAVQIYTFMKKAAPVVVILLMLSGCRMRIVDVIGSEESQEYYEEKASTVDPIVEHMAQEVAAVLEEDAADGSADYAIGYVPQDTPSDVPGDTTLDQDGDGNVGLIVDRYAGILAQGIGSIFDCQRLYVYFEDMRPYHTVNRFMAGHRLILDAGGHNIAAMRGNNALEVDTAWVQRRNPAVIVRTVGSNVLGANVTTTIHAQTVRDEILQRPYWGGVNAVLHRRVLIISEELLSTNEGMLVAKLYIASVMYPTLFADLDLDELVQQVQGGPGIFVF